MTSTTSTSEEPELLRPLPYGIEANWSEVDAKALDIIRRAVKAKRFPLYVWGNTGGGKTCLCALIFASWKNNNVHWVRAVEFTRRIQMCRREGQVMLPNSAYTVGEDSLWRSSIENPSLLVVDDLGISDASESQCAVIYELLERRRNRPLILSSNLSLPEIEKLYDDRISSRISAGTLLHFNIPDRRPSGHCYRVSGGTEK